MPVNIISSDPSYIYITRSDIYGGVQYTVALSPAITETIKWVQEHRRKLDEELKARQDNPAVASAYQQYETVLKLVLDQI